MRDINKKILTEDDCLALIANRIFGYCRGYTPGRSWTKVIRGVESCLSDIGIIDNDNFQPDYLKKRSWRCIIQESKIEIWEKNSKYIIIIGNSGEACETFLEEKSKITNKNYDINDNAKYKIKTLEDMLRKLGIIK